MNAEAPSDERARLFAEIAELKTQRNDLMAQLAECRRELRECREGQGQ